MEERGLMLDFGEVLVRPQAAPVVAEMAGLAGLDVDASALFVDDRREREIRRRSPAPTAELELMSAGVGMIPLMAGAPGVLIVALIALAIPVAHAAPGATDPQDTSVKILVAAASAYVAKYQQEFAFLLADESYSQTRTDAKGQTQNRVLESELFLTYLPADNEWVAVRDVVQADGMPVTGREDLRTLLSRREELRGLISQVVERNARYNIGLVTRNFNEPTLPLLLVGAKRINDVKFERKTVVRDAGVTLATLAFAERGRPTLVRGPGGSLPGKGEFVVEAGTGIVRHTRFELEKAGMKVRLTTEYARNDKIGLWLPSVFTERYEATNPLHEVVVCQATYSNYRRFDVTARIK